MKGRRSKSLSNTAEVDMRTFTIIPSTSGAQEEQHDTGSPILRNVSPVLTLLVAECYRDYLAALRRLQGGGQTTQKERKEHRQPLQPLNLLRPVRGGLRLSQCTSPSRGHLQPVSSCRQSKAQKTVGKESDKEDSGKEAKKVKIFTVRGGNKLGDCREKISGIVINIIIHALST